MNLVRYKLAFELVHDHATIYECALNRSVYLLGTLTFIDCYCNTNVWANQVPVNTPD